MPETNQEGGALVGKGAAKGEERGGRYGGVSLISFLAAFSHQAITSCELTTRRRRHVLQRRDALCAVAEAAGL